MSADFTKLSMLLEDLERGVVEVGLHEDNETSMYDVDGATDTMYYAAEALTTMAEALRKAQSVLAILIDPDSQHVSSLHVFAQATAAEAAAREALK